jgi:dimethylaniline monooxygenase (N-oxide forming)
MKVCVIGAGPSGLTTIKQLLDEGHDVTCFEKQGDVGGIWYRHEGDEDQMKVFDNLTLTISMKLMAYSDFRHTGDRVFFTNKEYFRYLSAYADKFGLRKHITFRTAVDNVRKDEDGRWHVTTSTQGGGPTEHTFAAIAVCAGPFQSPNLKTVPDLDKFTGEVVHSSRYRNNARYRGKKVLVVGLAESGADIVREVSDVSSECTLSLHSYSFIIPRLVDGKNATDKNTIRSHHYEMYVRATAVPYPMKAIFGDTLPSRLLFSAFTKVYGAANIASRVASSLLFKTDVKQPDPLPPGGKNRLGEPAVPEKCDIATENTQEVYDAVGEWNLRSHKHETNWTQRVIFSKNASFIPNVLNGKIEINDKGIEKISGRTVHFKDKTARTFDAIVLCTGFSRNFAALGQSLAVKENNLRYLYKHAFYPEHDGRAALIGFVRPYSGGIPICAEIQARYFAQLCSNKIKLPENINEQIRREKAWEETWTALSPGHTEAFPAQSMFIDSVAKEIGCLMPMSKLILNPRLLVRHWFYPYNQACYRLCGPHSDPENALKEMMAETPGPWTWPQRMLYLMGLSMMPHFVHPKYELGSRGIPKDALKPKGGLARARAPVVTASDGSEDPMNAATAVRRAASELP